MSTSASRIFRLVLVAVVAAVPSASGDDSWTQPVPVMNRAKIALTYRATVADGYLIVEANHSPGWHTYAMDNTVRARKASGSENPESELPTRITVSGAAKVSGPWRQTPPKDLSQPEIKWFTWGFEGIARFAVPIEKTGEGDVIVSIDAQSCDPASCTMVSGLEIVVPADAGSADASELVSGLVQVQSDGSPRAGG